MDHLTEAPSQIENPGNNFGIVKDNSEICEVKADSLGESKENSDKKSLKSIVLEEKSKESSKGNAKKNCPVSIEKAAKDIPITDYNSVRII